MRRSIDWLQGNLGEPPIRQELVTAGTARVILNTETCVTYEPVANGNVEYRLLGDAATITAAKIGGTQYSGHLAEIGAATAVDVILYFVYISDTTLEHVRKSPTDIA